MSERVRILGIDPGSRITGYGIIDVADGDPVHVVDGCLRVAEPDFAARLAAIFTGLGALVRDYCPDEVAIERVFVSRNADSALKLGQARGAALCATFAGGSGRPVFEYSAREIKQAVAGRGGAEKAQIQHMVRTLLRAPGELQADAADALAVALCRAHLRRTEKLLAAATGSRDGHLARGGHAPPHARTGRSWRSWRP